ICTDVPLYLHSFPTRRSSDLKSMPLTPTAAARFTRRADFLRRNASRLVIDGDVHPTERGELSPALRARIDSDANYYHGRPLLTEQLLAKMDKASVDMSMCW